MDLKLLKKRTLITGSSSGIGKSIAKIFDAEGCIIALNGRNANKLNSASKEFNNPLICQGDMENQSEADRVVKKCFDKLGGLDILICNIGSGQSVPPGKEDFNEWQKIFSINLWSATNTIEAAKPFLKKTNGVIVCISSICGVATIKNAPTTYTVAKSALNSYVKSVSLSLAKDGIRINAIAPGNIYFKGSVWDEKQKKDPEKVKKYIDQNVPLKTFGFPEDIANLALYLSSPLSKFSTGSIWTMDGGQTA